MHKPGTALEVEVAQYFRDARVAEVAHDAEIGGNQIDVVATERTDAGTIIRTIVECKDLGRPVGITRVNKFATIYALLKQKNLANAAWIVSSRGFSRPARKAAELEGIMLFDIEDLRARQKILRSLILTTFVDAKNIVVLGPEKTLLTYSSGQSIHTELAITDGLIEDKNNPKRIKLIADYITEIDRLSIEPTGSIVTVDLSGDAKAYSNWLTNPLYTAILQADQNYTAAYHRRNGSKGIAVQRNFVIDPSQLSSVSVENLRNVLRLHIKLGLVAGIIYKDSNIPPEILADMGALAERLCFDFGRAEAAHPSEVRLLDVIAPRGDSQFKRIRERIAWTAEPKNLSAIVSREEHIAEVIKDLEQRIRRKK